jgi:glycosyltransferase involved in cell wall biosynthesis
VSESEPFAAVAKPGDILCVFGAPWFQPEYHRMLERTKADLGLRVAILFYDLIPVIRPEFVIPDLTRVFTHWSRNSLPVADQIFAISRATANDLEAWADRTGLPIARPVVPVPIGTGFSDTPAPARPSEVAEPLVKGEYVLFVSTIEPRKNHDLAFRVWRNLLTELPPDRVPTLVFAGRVGWMSRDFMDRVAITHHLEGKLVVIEDPSDSDLAALYRDCRFTLFPSFYEGWGLPVTESLGFGKTCIASDRASVPEAGGAFCLYVDPDNVTGATEVIRRAIEDDALVASLEARIAAEFRPVPWECTARSILDRLG